MSLNVVFSSPRLDLQSSPSPISSPSTTLPHFPSLTLPPPFISSKSTTTPIISSFDHSSILHGIPPQTLPTAKSLHIPTPGKATQRRAFKTAPITPINHEATPLAKLPLKPKSMRVAGRKNLDVNKRREKLMKDPCASILSDFLIKCKGCDETIKLDDRGCRPFYLQFWQKHRDICERLPIECRILMLHIDRRESQTLSVKRQSILRCLKKKYVRDHGSSSMKYLRQWGREQLQLRDKVASGH